MNELKRYSLKFLRQNPLLALGSLWLAIVAVGLFGVMLLLPAGRNLNAVTLPSFTQIVGAQEALPNPRVAGATYADIVERTAPAVVRIRTERQARAQQIDPRLEQFFGGRAPQMRQAPARAMGSGVIVESNGTILTNNHVVENATKVTVELPDKRTFTARVVGTDAPSDLAVLKVEATGLPVVPLGDSDRVRVGDIVLAIGNPLGLQQTVTSGIISAKGRSTGVSDGSYEDFLQTDAPINQGNSGGALISSNGELIGINSQILSPSGGNVGIGFAIPSNMARSIMTQLVRTGTVQRGQLGVEIQEVNSEVAANLGLNEVRGVLINSVAPGGAAERAGLRRGDVIVGFNDAPLSDGNELRNRVAATEPGGEVNLKVVRNGGEQNIRVKVGALTTARNSTENGSRQYSPRE